MLFCSNVKDLGSHWPKRRYIAHDHITCLLHTLIIKFIQNPIDVPYNYYSISNYQKRDWADASMYAISSALCFVINRLHRSIFMP